MLTPIRATDALVMPFPPEKIWPVLADVAGYARWWPPSLRLRIIKVEPGVVGSEVEIRPPGGRSFRCRFDAVNAPRRMRMTYYGGFIEGHGEWRLEPLAAGTRVVYELDVQARGWIVALLGRVLSLSGLHSRQMRSVLEQIETFADD